MRLPSPQLLKGVALAAAVTTFAGVALLGAHVHSGQDLVLLRNAVISEIGPARAYDWTPASVPEGFAVETLEPPEAIRRFAASATAASEPGNDFDEAVDIAAALTRNRKRGRGPIQSDTLTALRRITTEGAGYCADYTQVFNALASSSGISVREWGMSFDGYGGDGHAFSEIWNARSGRWVFLDSFFSFYVTDPTGRPLSVIEFRAALLQGAPSIHVVPIDPDKFGFKSADKAIDYYRRGAPRFFMIWGNNVLSYDAEPLVRVAGDLSRAAEQVAGIATGVQPRIVIPADLVDRESARELSQLRSVMLVVASGLLVAAAALALLLVKRT